MSDEIKKLQFIKVILQEACGNLALAKLRSDPPMLGEANAIGIRRLAQKIQDHAQELEGQLQNTTFARLSHVFDASGKPLEEFSKKWCEQARNVLNPLTKRLFGWHLAAFEGEDEFFADTDYWSKMNHLGINEALWLSVGLEPVDDFQKTLYVEPGAEDNRTDEAVFMSRRRELFVRALFNSRNPTEYKASTILDWIGRVHLEIHPSFREILDGMYSAEISSTPLSSALGNGAAKRYDKREIDSIAQLFTAMAIEQFGYDPTAKRSPTVKEIQDLAASLGITMSDDTIRHYLRHGAKFIDPEWKPHNR